MLIVAAMAVGAGIIAGSLALTSFGFDSVIELCLLYRVCSMFAQMSRYHAVASVSGRRSASGDCPYLASVPS